MTTWDRVPTKRDWAPILVPVGIALLSLVISAWTGYTSSDKELNRRITTVETQQKNDGSRLERIENKVDRILERIK